MRDRDSKVIREGDTLSSCYGIPPTSIEATVKRIEQYGQGRLICLTPGHNPEQCTLAEFMESMDRDVLIIKRKYEP